MSRHTTHTRDAALRRLSHANRWLIAGSVALTGVLTEVAANAFPGKTLGKTASRSRSATNGGGSRSTTTTAPLQPPAAPPQSASQGEGDSGATGTEEGAVQ